MIYANKQNGFNYKEVVSDGAQSEVVVVKHGRNEGNVVGVAIITSGNNGKVQYTFSSLAEVEAGTANWIDWSYGEVTSNTGTAFVAPVTAVKGASVSGEITLEVAV